MDYRKLVVFIWALGLLAAFDAPAGDWPAFRGPNGDGTADEQQIPVHWGPDQNIRWKVPLPAPGNSSPIVTGDRVFVTVAEDNGKTRSLICFDRQTGKQQWAQSVRYEADEETHQTNPHAAPTPVTDGQRVVVWYGSAGMHCYTVAGKKLWSQDLGSFHHIWGYGSSPILHDGHVIQLCGPGERTMLAAVRLSDGRLIWQVPEPGGSDGSSGRYVGSWGTPVVVEVNGQDQILVGLPTRVAAFDPVDGFLLWYVRGLSGDRSDVCYTSPLANDEIGMIMGGYGGPEMGFRLGGQGDVTDENRLWHNAPTAPRLPQRIGTGVLVDGYVYMANADGAGSIECIDLRTGVRTWEQQRTPDGPHWGSMIYVDGRLYVTGQKGITRVIAANPRSYEVLAENDLQERSNSTPAASNGQLFLRTFEHLYCIEE